MANRNRTAGNSWELEVIKDLKQWYPNAISSRQESRAKDAQKIDICNVPWNIQCKNTASKADYHNLLNQIPCDQVPVIVHKYTRKSAKNFVVVGKYAVLRYEDFLQLIGQIEQCKAD